MQTSFCWWLSCIRTTNLNYMYSLRNQRCLDSGLHSSQALPGFWTLPLWHIDRQCTQGWKPANYRLRKGASMTAGCHSVSTIETMGLNALLVSHHLKGMHLYPLDHGVFPPSLNVIRMIMLTLVLTRCNSELHKYKSVLILTGTMRAYTKCLILYLADEFVKTTHTLLCSMQFGRIPKMVQVKSQKKRVITHPLACFRMTEAG